MLRRLVVAAVVETTRYEAPARLAATAIFSVSPATAVAVAATGWRLAGADRGTVAPPITLVFPAFGAPLLAGLPLAGAPGCRGNLAAAGAPILVAGAFSSPSAPTVAALVVVVAVFFAIVVLSGAFAAGLPAAPPAASVLPLMPFIFLDLVGLAAVAAVLVGLAAEAATFVGLADLAFADVLVGLPFAATGFFVSFSSSLST